MLVTHAYAQDLPGEDKLDVYDLAGGFVSLPLKINTKGEFSFTAGANDLVFTPTVHMGFSRTNNLYVLPEKSDSLTFSDIGANNKWIEIKRLRIEYGLGLSAMLKGTYGLGLIPFKGSNQTFIKIKNDPHELSPSLTMPKTLDEIQQWGPGDSGSFQTYGGVELYASIGVPLTTLAQTTMTFQNLFKIGVKKTGADSIEFSIEEESVNRTELKLGPWFVNGRYGKMKGQTFKGVFSLKLSDPKHHDLFKVALKGKISELQRRISLQAQKIEWKGTEKRSYFGIPFVIGQNRSNSEYEYDENGEETQLNLTSRKNGGILAAIGNHSQYLYQNDESIMLYWTSEMSRPSAKILKKRFLSVGVAIGLDNFSRSVPLDKKLGSVLTNLGVTFTKSEIEGLSSSNLEEIERNLITQCEDLNLKCRKEKTYKKIMKSLRIAAKTSWLESRKTIGSLLIKEPALIYSFIKTMNLKKKVYFRFLSGNFQSQEGLAAVPL